MASSRATVLLANTAVRLLLVYCCWTSGPATVFGADAAATNVFAAGIAVTEVPSFRHDVMAVLSKAGCNMGACHGNQNGKGGFKLSLRGQDPDVDFLTLSRDLSGRRTNALDPDASLLLRKPTLDVAHEGGLRFRRTDPEYQILARWLAAGMPRDDGKLVPVRQLLVEPSEVILTSPQHSFTLRTTAVLDDGSQRDVTRLTVFEASTPLVEIDVNGVVTAQGTGEVTIIARYLHLQVPVRAVFIPARPDFVWQGPSATHFIDRAVFTKLQRLRMNPSPRVDDLTFLRRASLDLTGLIPTADEARAFQADMSPDKRQKLVTKLLEQPAYADWWALKWSDLLRNEEKTIDRKGVQNFHAWIRESLAQDKPFDQFIRELIAARGSTYTAPAANYYRALRDPLQRAETTAQLFLGIRLQCAKCHNHPFDRWTQDDYYNWADVFARVDYKILENNRRDTNDQHEFDGEQIVYMKRSGDIKNPRTGQPCTPRFLGAASDVPRDADRLEKLAEWLTGPSERQWARVVVNRVWAHLMGRGLVEPVDDFRATNPPSHPQLLEQLTDDFLQHDCSLKHLLQTIVLSQTYQLSAVPDATNQADELNFSHAIVRRLTAEQLLDALSQVTGATVDFQGYPEGLRAIEVPGVLVRGPNRRRSLNAAEGFLRVFGKPQRLQNCDCERSADSTLSQAFQLVSGRLMNELLAQKGNQIQRWLTDKTEDSQIIDQLFWRSLGRPPSPQETAELSQLLAAATDLRQMLEDIVWGVLNSDEFLLRR